jgi:hypothetical protein
MKSGQVVLIADDRRPRNGFHDKQLINLQAAHAVVPYAGQSHAMAMEDAASLGECLARAKNSDDIPQAL